MDGWIDLFESNQIKQVHYRNIYTSGGVLESMKESTLSTERSLLFCVGIHSFTYIHVPCTLKVKNICIFTIRVVRGSSDIGENPSLIKNEVFSRERQSRKSHDFEIVG